MEFHILYGFPYTKSVIPYPTHRRTKPEYPISLLLLLSLYCLRSCVLLYHADVRGYAAERALIDLAIGQEFEWRFPDQMGEPKRYAGSLHHDL